jgi:hypothetical protein
MGDTLMVHANMDESSSEPVPDGEKPTQTLEGAAAPDATGTPDPAAPAAPADPARPDWLPEKFESPEAMAKAYAELETKQGTQDPKAPNDALKLGTPEEPETPEGTPPAGGQIMTEARNEFFDTGGLTQETMDGLAKAGYPREVVEQYIAGQKALHDQQVSQAHAVTGGPEGYQKMALWATQNLSQAEVDAFDQVMVEGAPETAQMVLAGMWAKYQAAGGVAPGDSVEPTSTLQARPTTAGTVRPYGSMAELVADQMKPEYDKDPSFQAKVMERIKVSPEL